MTIDIDEVIEGQAIMHPHNSLVNHFIIQCACAYKEKMAGLRDYSD